MSRCMVDECPRPLLARGMCQMHYARWYRGSDVGPANLIRAPGDPNATEKACTICGEIKPLGDFYTEKRNSHGRMSSCKSCFNKRDGESKVLRKYGLTPAEHQEMVRKQRGRCGCCGENASKLVIDHCHRSGRVRALLCDRCNWLLGAVDDDPAVLTKAIRFLRRHQNESPQED